LRHSVHTMCKFWIVQIKFGLKPKLGLNFSLSLRPYLSLSESVASKHWCIVAVDRRVAASEAAASVGDYSDKDDNVSFDDDDEYGFDPKLHIWHPSENPVITEERPDGIVVSV